MERVLSGELTKVMINMPPRYSKTETCVKNFISHGLALNAASKYIHLSYSKSLALDNSEGVRNIVNSEAYQALFPDVQIKPKSDAKEKWYTTSGGGVYATATGGQVTGFGAGEVDEEENFEAFDNIDLNFLDSVLTDDTVYGDKSKFSGALIIDDPIKPEDADSDLRRGRINERFDSTIRNRVNSRRTPIIIIMQRLHEDDLCGHLLEEEPGEWFVLTLPAILDEYTENECALWPHKHTLEELKHMRSLNKIVFERQYQQKPMPKEGLMYDTFKIYQIYPITLRSIRKAYIDTADKGKDFLCCIIYIESDEGIYVIDVYYTEDGMETTEPQTAILLKKHMVEVARVEYNAGGEGFKRSVERQSRILRNYKTKFVGFTQTDNKDVRIFQASAEVNNMIHMPHDWAKRWPLFHKDVTRYLKKGGNAHDDAPDSLTGCFEWFGKDKYNIAPSWVTGIR